MRSIEMRSTFVAQFLELLTKIECGVGAEITFKVTRTDYAEVKDIKFPRTVSEGSFQFSLDDGALRNFRKYFPKV